MIMTPKHSRWTEFYNRLSQIPNCDHTADTAIEVLNSMGMDVAASLDYFRAHGGYCDCEILMNVEPFDPEEAT